MRDLSNRGDLLAINTATLGHRQPLTEIVDGVAAAGFGAIAPWRREIDEAHPEKAAKLFRDAGLHVSGYCRTTYLSGADAASRAAAIADNVHALHVAAAIEADCFVAVVGGLADGSHDCAESRAQILAGLAELGETAAQLKIPIALEPLHPFYAAERSLLNTITQAVAWCKQLDPAGHGTFGICVDAYHVWWDPDLAAALRAATGRILSYHVSDWLVPTADPLLDRGMPGDGVIALPELRAAVEETGYAGFVEVEIFSERNWWQRPPAEVLGVCRERMTSVC